MKQNKKTAAVRSFKMIVEDFIWPETTEASWLKHKTEIEFESEMDMRHKALKYVLCRIPEDDYQKLVDKIDDFSWFIPPVWDRGSTEFFKFNFTEKLPKNSILKPCEGSKVLHLSALLEHTAFDIIVAIVAHELAHIFLEHIIIFSPPNHELYMSQENQAFEYICKWGFSREAKKHRAYLKQRDTRNNW